MQPLCVGQQTKVLQVVPAPICCLENQTGKKKDVFLCFVFFAFPRALCPLRAAVALYRVSLTQLALLMFIRLDIWGQAELWLSSPITSLNS